MKKTSKSVGSMKKEPSFETSKRASSAQLLFKCARLWNEWAMRRTNETFPQSPTFRAAHTALLPHIDFEGVRQTTLAERARVSKQAIHPLIEDLVSMGTLERIADPTDKRAKLVRFTKQGQFGVMRGLALLGELEQEMAQAIGDKHMLALHSALLKVHDVLVEQEASLLNE